MCSRCTLQVTLPKRFREAPFAFCVGFPLPALFCIIRLSRHVWLNPASRFRATLAFFRGTNGVLPRLSGHIRPFPAFASLPRLRCGPSLGRQRFHASHTSCL